MAEPCPGPLPPVPATAGDALVVPPDDLARVHGLHNAAAIPHCVTRLPALGADKPWRPGIGGGVLPSDRDGIADAEGVVEIDDRIHRGQPAVFLDLPAQRIGGAWRSLRLGAEAAVGVAPAFKVSGAPFSPSRIGACRLQQLLNIGVGRGIAQACAMDAQRTEGGSELQDLGADLGRERGFHATCR